MTLIEVMVAALILMVGVLAVAGLIDAANKSTVTARERQTATNLTRELIEAARGLPYASIAGANTLAAIATSDPQLGDAQPGSPYTIVRNNVTYTIASDVCILDDGRDGGGSHAGGSFCPDSAAATALHPLSGQNDRVPEDYKRVRITTTWKTRGPERRVVQTTLVNNPGSAGAPAVESLTATNPALGNPPAQVVSATSIVFAVKTTSTPTQVKWLLDGATQGLATGSARDWGFTWNLGTVGTAGSYGDGPYLVSAEAFDSYGVSGASRSMTVTLNRSVPRPPAGVAGGRNNDIVEMEWLPNPERDLAGYQVFRMDGTTEVLVCALQFRTSCVDTSTSSGGDKVYKVRSYDRDTAGTLRLGGTTELTVVSNNTPPKPPENACVTWEADLSAATLVWTKPSPVQDVDAGDSIAFYRIYRGGTARTNRYTKVSAEGTTHSFKDATNGSSHSYWLSSVDTRYGESNLVAVAAC